MRRGRGQPRSGRVFHPSVLPFQGSGGRDRLDVERRIAAGDRRISTVETPPDPVDPTAGDSEPPGRAKLRPAATLDDRWVGIGGGSAPVVQVTAVALWWVNLPFRRPVVTAVGVHRARPLAMVQILGHAEDGPVEGWGECAALADTTYDTEDVAPSYAALEHLLVPALLRRTGETGPKGSGLPRPSDLDDIRDAAPTAPLAFAALEMAVA